MLGPGELNVCLHIKVRVGEASPSTAAILLLTCLDFVIIFRSTQPHGRLPQAEQLPMSAIYYVSVLSVRSPSGLRGSLCSGSHESESRC